jgi:hypothetical protein
VIWQAEAVPRLSMMDIIRDKNLPAMVVKAKALALLIAGK